MIIRPATPADLPAILEIYNHEVLHANCTAEYEPRSMQVEEAWYRDHVEKGFPVLVAETPEGRIAGWSSLSPYHPRIGYRYTCEDSIYIAEEYRGKGLGKLLLAPLIESAREMGLHAVIGAITSDNEASIRLHAGFGFVEKGRLNEVIFKFDHWLDVTYMELML
ncbi:MAG TPA: GNAT family N-acetyltransferase [Capsulimonadaceae bacterium]|nr:GNAT family N-acetyltransferase [Capsulimonadaceae bacterium]